MYRLVEHDDAILFEIDDTTVAQIMKLYGGDSCYEACMFDISTINWFKDQEAAIQWVQERLGQNPRK